MLREVDHNAFIFMSGALQSVFSESHKLIQYSTLHYHTFLCSCF